MRYFIVSFTAICIMAGCSKTSQEKLLLEAHQQELCNKDTLSFQEHVHPIIQANCMPCHSSAQAESGIVLETYNDINGVAAGGLLVGVVKHDPGFLAMPKDRPKLSDCEIRAIETWVNQGALNN